MFVQREQRQVVLNGMLDNDQVRIYATQTELSTRTLMTLSGEYSGPGPSQPSP